MTEILTAAEYLKKISGKKPRKKMEHPEQDFQIALAEVLEPLSRLHKFWWSHFPAGGWRSRAEAGIFKAMGTKSGAGDCLFIPLGGRAHWIELKVNKRKQSDVQIEFEETIVALGCLYAVAYSIDEVLDILRGWEIIP